MERTPQIRPAVSDEVDVLCAVRRSAILALAETMGEDRTRTWAQRERRELLADAIASGSVWVAESANQILGFVATAGNLVTWLYVRPNCAGQGIGTRLLEHAEEGARLAGFGTTRLESSPNAEAFYSNRGYRSGKRSADGAQPMIKSLARPR